jgi:hypothetical protein
MLGLGRLPLPAANPRAGPALLSDDSNVIFWSLAVINDVVMANTSLGCACGSRVSGSGIWRWGWVHVTSCVTCLRASTRLHP